MNIATTAGNLSRQQAVQHTPGSARSNPLVTVVVTTYNRPTYLGDAVDSVADQTYEPIELVVVDDHSDTPARRQLAHLSGDEFHAMECIRHETNRGANAARNTGIQAASGKYIAFLDDDDTWIPTKIALQVDALETNDAAGVTYTGAITKAAGGTDIDIPPRVEGNITKILLCYNVVGTLSSIMVRRSLACEIPFDERFPSWADLEWYINLSTETEFHRIGEPLVIYEFESHNRLSEDVEKKRVAYERFLEKFDDLAAQFGWPFRRKMRGWAAYRLGSAAVDARRYQLARQYLGRAIVQYPFEPRFHEYFLVTLGGRYTHSLARSIKRALASVSAR